MFGFSNSLQSQDKNGVLADSSPNNLSAVKFASGNNFFSASSWDGDICVWLYENGTITKKAKTKFQFPILDIDWSNNLIVGAGSDNNGYIWDISSNQQKKFAVHSSPIRKICTLKENPNMVSTGSWDCSVKFWDLRKQQQALSCNLAERVYAMDCKSFVLAVALAEKGIVVYDTRNPNSPVKTFNSPLRLQTRSISIFKENDGICIGSIEGRISVQYFQNESASFNFKAHREKPNGQNNENAYAVNGISFHPKFGTFVSCGSGGKVISWDKKTKRKIKMFCSAEAPINDVCFNSDGSLLAFCSSYDYYKGKINQNNQTGKVFVKKCENIDFESR